MKVLIVDDDGNAREIFRRMLEQEGSTAISCAASVAEAMVLLDDPEQAFELVLIDYAMPHIDGIAGCRMMRAHPRGRALQLILTSTDHSAATRLAAREAGAAGFVAKPIDRQALLAALHAAGGEFRRASLLNELEQDLARGAAAQRDLLRDAPARFGGMRMAWRMLPGTGVSGDYVNLFALDDDRLAFCMADVVGHGVGSALFAVSLHALLSPNRAGGWMRDADGGPRRPREVAERANREFPDLGGERYFTFIYGIVDRASRHLRYVQAGHPGMILCAADGRGEILGEGDLPIGMFASAEYHDIERDLAPGSRLLVYSDGLIEARRGGRGEIFGQQRLLDLLCSIADADGGHVLDEILQSVRRWRHPAPPDDDQSLLILQLDAS